MSEPQAINLSLAMFRQELSKRLDSIGRLCTKWGVPMTKRTLILRDPANDDMCLVQTNEDILEDALRVARLLEEKGR